MAYDEEYNEPEEVEVLVRASAPQTAGALVYAHTGDAGADLCTTGVSLALPAGYVGLVHPRSGLAVKQGVTVLNAPGTIDAGYRGQIKVPLINLDPTHTVVLHAGERIAQLVIQRYVEARFVPAETLPGSDRAERGFGSTGL